MLAAVLGAVFLGFGITQLLALHPGIGSGPTPTPGQSELQTTQPSASPTATPVPTPVPTATPTPIPTPQPTDPPPPGAPSSPRNLTAVVSVGHIALSWSAPTSSGGSNVFRYDLYRDGSGSPFWTGNAFSHTDIVGNGATHVYRVTAVNAAGSSAYSSPAGGTTPDVPGVPGNPQAVGGVGQITLTWLAPASNGKPIIRYDIYRNGSLAFSVTTLSKTDTGLAAGTLYTYVIKAVNAIGSSVGGSAFATTAAIPGAPTTVTATGGAGKVDVFWTAPASDGGSPVTSYEVYRDASVSPLCTGLGQPCTDSGRGPAESHTYTVKARNLVGLGPGTAAVGTSWNVPGAPATVTATGGAGKVDVFWTAPASDGGSPVTSYEVYRDASVSPLCTGLGQPCTDNSLLPGQSHTYTVKARNLVGLGPGTAAVGTSWNVPGAPATVTATGGAGKVDVFWTAPASDGGSPVTSYEVYRDASVSPLCTGLGQPCTDNSLLPGQSHTYTVKARNIVGLGPGTAKVGTSWNVPGAPQSVTASGGNGTVAVTWTAPASDGGSPVTSYEVYRDASVSPLCTGLGQPCIDSGRTPGESHNYTVKARNIVGLGAGTTDVGTAWDVPSVVSNLTASSGGLLQITVDWNAASCNFACTLTYDVYRDGGFVTNTSSTSFVDSPLGPLESHDYYIIARNQVGPGAASGTVTGTTGP